MTLVETAILYIAIGAGLIFAPYAFEKFEDMWSETTERKAKDENEI